MTQRVVTQPAAQIHPDMAQLRWEPPHSAAATPRGRLLLCATQRLPAGDSSRGKATPGLEQALKAGSVLGRSAAGQVPASQHILGLAAGNLESHRALTSHASSQSTTGVLRGPTHLPVLQLMVLVIMEPTFPPSSHITTACRRVGPPKPLHDPIPLLW